MIILAALEDFMIKYLNDFLRKRVGAAPVWVRMQGERGTSQFIMVAVDEIGVVLATPSNVSEAIAYPWAAIQFIMPHQAKS